MHQCSLGTSKHSSVPPSAPCRREQSQDTTQNSKTQAKKLPTSLSPHLSSMHFRRLSENGFDQLTGVPSFWICDEFTPCQDDQLISISKGRLSKKKKESRKNTSFWTADLSLWNTLVPPYLKREGGRAVHTIQFEKLVFFSIRGCGIIFPMFPAQLAFLTSI